MNTFLRTIRHKLVVLAAGIDGTGTADQILDIVDEINAVLDPPTWEDREAEAAHISRDPDHLADWAREEAAIRAMEDHGTNREDI